MRIVYVTYAMPYGTQEAFVIPEIEEVRRQGHQVLVVPLLPKGGIVHEDARVLAEQCTRAVPLFSAEVAKIAAREAARAPQQVTRLLGQMMGAGSRRNRVKNLALFPKGLWLAHQIRQWQADVIHAHWATGGASLALIAATLAGIPWAFTAHRFDIAENNLLDDKARSAAFVRAIDQAGAAEFASHLAPGTPHPTVIHMGVAMPAEVAPVDMSSTDALKLIMAANFKEKKGHRYLIEALGLLKKRGVNVTLDLAGDGPLLDEVKAQVERLDINDRVSFLGMMPHDRLLERQQRGDWDVLVLPSVVAADGDKEGIPVSLIEALGSGLPAVSTPTGGISELMGDGAGVLVPPRDAAALAAALEGLVRHPERRQELARAGRQRVAESFEIRTVVTDILRRLEAAVSSQGSTAEELPVTFE